MPVESVTSHTFVALAAFLLSLLLGTTLARITRYTALRQFFHRKLHQLCIKLNRQHRADITRAMRGALLLLILPTASWIVGHFIDRIINNHAHPALFLSAILLLGIMLRVQHGFLPLWRITKTEENSWPALLMQLTAIPMAATDSHGQLRLLVLQCFSHLNYGIIGGIIAYIAAGFGGFFVILSLASLSRHNLFYHPEWHAFFLVSHYAIRILLLPITIFTLLLALLAAMMTPTTKPYLACKALFKRNDYFLSALLQMGLGGPYRQFGIMVQAPFIGRHTAKTEHRHAKRASIVFGLISLMILLLLAFNTI